MTFKPLGNRVVVKPFAPEEKTESGIIIPIQAQGKEPLVKGEVKAIGEVDSVAVEDVVMFYQSEGSEIQYDGDNCVLLREDALVAVFAK